MKEAHDWITHFHLAPHPEGGYFQQTYRSPDILARSGLPSRYDSERVSATAIYFLLESGDVSKFHRLRSDEVWCYHAGSPLMLYVLQSDGSLQTSILGIDLDKQECPQVVIPHGVWFGARVIEPASYTLMSCLVSPGFEYEDFELADRGQLLREYPQHKTLIEQLT